LRHTSRLRRNTGQQRAERRGTRHTDAMGGAAVVVGDEAVGMG